MNNLKQIKIDSKFNLNDYLNKFFVIQHRNSGVKCLYYMYSLNTIIYFNEKICKYEFIRTYFLCPRINDRFNVYYI